MNFRCLFRMKKIKLFTDGSVNTRSNEGYGAYLVVDEEIVFDELLQTKIQLIKFENTSSTKLELQVLLWALKEVKAVAYDIEVYTDSQNIIRLPERRDRFEKNDYHSKNGKRLKNFKLYQEFFRITDTMNCRFVKVHGHQKSHQKDEIHKLFTLVDRASRKAVRAG